MARLAVAFSAGSVNVRRNPQKRQRDRRKRAVAGGVSDSDKTGGRAVLGGDSVRGENARRASLKGYPSGISIGERGLWGILSTNRNPIINQ
ncbi:hypothetical protein ACFX13_024330 [Malus domestica]